MHPTFKEALDHGYLEPATWNDGSPFVHEGVTYYCATQSGANLSIKRWHTLTDIMARHATLKLTDGAIQTTHAVIKDLANQAMRQMLRGDGQEPDTTPLEEIKAAVARLEQRMSLGMDTDMLMELASVWFLTEADHVGEYDPVRGRQYRAAWARDPTIRKNCVMPIIHLN